MDNMKNLCQYVHVVTVASHNFWLMGLVSFDKAVHSLAQAVAHRPALPEGRRQRCQLPVASAGKSLRQIKRNIKDICTLILFSNQTL